MRPSRAGKRSNTNDGSPVTTQPDGTTRNSSCKIWRWLSSSCSIATMRDRRKRRPSSARKQPSHRSSAEISCGVDQVAGGVSERPALVIRWSRNEPERTGEVLLIPDSAAPWVFGRGETSPGTMKRIKNEVFEHVSVGIELAGAELLGSLVCSVRTQRAPRSSLKLDQFTCQTVDQGFLVGIDVASANLAGVSSLHASPSSLTLVYLS